MAVQKPKGISIRLSAGKITTEKLFNRSETILQDRVNEQICHKDRKTVLKVLVNLASDCTPLFDCGCAANCVCDDACDEQVMNKNSIILKSGVYKFKKILFFLNFPIHSPQIPPPQPSSYKTTVT